MRISKKLLTILAIAVSLVAVQNVLAATTITVAGTVSQISTDPNMVVIDDDGVLTEVYGIRLNYLANQYNIFIEEGTAISVDAYEYLCSDGTIKLMASSITVNDVTVQLRSVP